MKDDAVGLSSNEGIKRVIIPYSYNAFTNALADTAAENNWFFFKPPFAGIKRLKKIVWTGYILNAASTVQWMLQKITTVTAVAKLTDYSGHVTSKNIGNDPEEVTLPSGKGVGFSLCPDVLYNFENCVFQDEMLLQISIGNYTGAAIYYSISFYAEVEVSNI